MTVARDILILASAAAVAYGLWQMWPPLAWVVLGTVIGVGLLTAERRGGG